MNVQVFPQGRCFTDEAELSAAFDARIALAPGATLTCEGRISIEDNVRFAGDCRLGEGTTIGSGSVLTELVMGRDNCVRPYSIAEQLSAGDGNLFGPFCFLRGGCVVGDHCILGAHVEATRSRFADGVKISHRAFIGDADLGADAIVGAGVVFCNYDRGERRATQVGAGAIIGSGTMLVAPLVIGQRVVIGAGSVVTRDVAAGTILIQKRPISALREAE
jgi:bifunctional UDP-N-acetylglucosamine pyrophosphorylase / glucosamine-1-phosphate N-acetyltransferase